MRMLIFLSRAERYAHMSIPKRSRPPHFVAVKYEAYAAKCCRCDCLPPAQRQRLFRCLRAGAAIAAGALLFSAA